jgi:hypothetical protein
VDAKAFEQHCAVLQWWCELLEWALKDGDCVWPAVAPRQRVAALLLWNPVEVVRAACEDRAWYAIICGAPQIPVRSATDILRFMKDKKHPEWSVDTERVAATLHVCSSLDRAYALDGGEATVRVGDVACALLMNTSDCVVVGPGHCVVGLGGSCRRTVLPRAWRVARELSSRKSLTVGASHWHAAFVPAVYRIDDRRDA